MQLSDLYLLQFSTFHTCLYRIERRPAAGVCGKMFTAVKAAVIADHTTFHNIYSVSLSCDILKRHNLSMKQIYRLDLQGTLTG